MKLQKILNRLQKLHPKEIDLSLDRIQNLCEKLGNPQENLKFISIENFCETLNFYIKWFKLIETLDIPVRTSSYGEYQLGKRDLYPNVGGAIKQKANKIKNNSKLVFTGITEKNFLKLLSIPITSKPLS